MSGQLGDDRSERISGVGADDDIPARESPGIVTNVTISARSAASARAFGPRTAITTGVRRSGPSSSLSDVTASRT
jgi:hypothetical protein